jgi:hypothetical protein
MIHLKADDHVLAFYCLVGYGRIIRIDSKVNIGQTIHELAIVQHAYNHCNVKGILALYQQLF